MLAITFTSLIVLILATVANTSSNLMTSLCTNPFATSLAFMLGFSFLEFIFTLKTRIYSDFPFCPHFGVPPLFLIKKHLFQGLPLLLKNVYKLLRLQKIRLITLIFNLKQPQHYQSTSTLFSISHILIPHKVEYNRLRLKSEF